MSLAQALYWVDLSGTGNYTNGYKVGSMVNGISYNTSNGGCLSFDGSDDQVKFDQGTNTSNPIYLTGAFTAMFWVKTSSNERIVFSLEWRTL